MPKRSHSRRTVDSPTIRITVEGPLGQQDGKAEVAMFIAQALESAGLAVALTDNDAVYDNLTLQTLPEVYLDAMSDVFVKIEVKR